VSPPIPGIVPNLLGHTLANAGSLLSPVGLHVGHLKYQNSAAPSQTILAQVPPAGARLAIGAAVDLIVSAGPSIPTGPPTSSPPTPPTSSLVSVPNLVGLNVAQARSSLSALGLLVGNITPIGSLTAPGIILAENPQPGSMVTAGSAIDVTVSGGPSSSVPRPLTTRPQM
jgi:beta-lactam-binding protein with PASTA domain